MKKVLFGIFAVVFSMPAMAVTVSGKVLDKDDNLSVLATVSAPGTTKGFTIFNDDGSFSESMDVDENTELVVSHTGCTPQTFKASELKNITIQLYCGNKLEEVIIGSSKGDEEVVDEEPEDDLAGAGLNPVTPRLSQQESEQKVSELQDNYDAVRGNEQSLANRTLGATAMATVGAGGQMTASSLSEQKSDADAERDMAAYLATFRCDWGSGRNVRGGETNVELPGAGQLIPMYSEYVTLANDLKLRKAQLGLKAGIESEPILDSATTGLYDDVSTGISSGAYASLARALQNPNGADAKMWAEQKEKTAENLKTGVGLVATGVAASVAGNAIINRDAPRDRSREIIAKFESLFSSLEEEVVSISPTPCSGEGVVSSGFVPECECIDKAARYFSTEGVCRSCPLGQHYNNNNECVPNTTAADTSGKCTLTEMVKKGKCECVENAESDENGVCECKKNFDKIDNQCNCYLWPTGSDLVDWDNCRCAKGAGWEFIGNAGSESIPEGAKYCQPCDEGFHTDPETNRCVKDEIVEVKEEVQESAPQKPKPAILPADNLFEVGKAVVRDEAIDALARFVQEFKEQDTTLLGEDFCVRVVGHTDRTGWPSKCGENKKCSEEKNNTLSKDRARAVAKVLVEGGIEALNICAVGRGQSDCDEKNYERNDPRCRHVKVSFDLEECPGDCLPWNQK